MLPSTPGTDSENQRPESLEDQVLACRTLAADRGFVVLEDHIYADRAQSGALKDRPALSDLVESVHRRVFDVLLVDDLSRLARDSVFMLSLIGDLRFLGIRLVSVADGVDTADEHATLSIQIRGIFNELTLEDLKKKTLRGQRGQKERGFSVGERTFGYHSHPVGELRLDKHGRARPDGHEHRVYEPEAAVVRRIFEARDAGLSLNGIVCSLNKAGVLGQFGSSKRWSMGTISRMLRNTKYMGRWVWNKTGNRRDYRTGRRRPFEKPESEWMIRIDESLRIVSQDLWDRVQQRRAAVGQVYPPGAGGRGFSGRQGSRATVFPRYLLSGAMVCARCGRKIVLVSGKGDGYYSCSGGRLRACENRLRVPRRRAEDIILGSVQHRLSQPAVLREILERLVAEVEKLCATVPASFERKTTELGQVRRRVDRLVDFIARGRESRAVAEELAVTERRVEVLEAEVEAMKRARSVEVRAPSLGWLEKRLAAFRTVLERRTAESATLLRRLLGKITLEPTQPETGAPYYVARTALDVLVLLDPDGPGPDPDPGARSLRWWRRRVLHFSPRTTWGCCRVRRFPATPYPAAAGHADPAGHRPRGLHRSASRSPARCPAAAPTRAPRPRRVRGPQGQFQQAVHGGHVEDIERPGEVGAELLVDVLAVAFRQRVHEHRSKWHEFHRLTLTPQGCIPRCTPHRRERAAPSSPGRVPLRSHRPSSESALSRRCRLGLDRLADVCGSAGGRTPVEDY